MLGAGLAWALGMLWGMAGIWASVALSYVATLAVLEVVRRRLGLNRLFLPAGFEADPANIVEFKVRSAEDVCQCSDVVMDFCRKHGLDTKKTMALGVAAEELAKNSVEYGFGKGGSEVDLRLVRHEDELTMRLRDDCPRFNPENYREYLTSDDPFAGFGIRMVLGLADEVNYVPLLNRNCVYVKVTR